METHMRKLFAILLATCILFPLSAQELPRFPSASVRLVGVIQPRDLQISVYNEAGDMLTPEEAFMNFEFPALEEWEVERSLFFRYSSHLSAQKVGKLIFELTDVAMNEMNRLRTTIELTSEHRMTSVENGDTFRTTFLGGAQDEVPIGKLTVRIRKRAEDVFSAGTYAGAFSINYTEGS